MNKSDTPRVYDAVVIHPNAKARHEKVAELKKSIAVTGLKKERS